MNAPLLLTIDFGTQSVRAVVFDSQGNVVSNGTVGLDPPQGTGFGIAEQDPQYLLRCLSDACTEALHERSVARRIGAVALASCRASVVAVDDQGCALRPVIMWPDQRCAQSLPLPGGVTRWLALLPRVGPTLRRLQHQAECNWLAQREPQIWQRTDKFLLLSGFLLHFLTGDFVDSSAAQIGYLPFNFRQATWANPRAWQWQLLPALSPSQLPRLAAPGERIGTITPEAAARTHIPIDTPVVASAADKAAEVLGCGIVDATAACLSYGTAATVNLVSPRYQSPGRGLPAYPAAAPGRFLLETQVNQGFWLVRWFKEQFGSAEQMLAESRTVTAETLIDQLLEQSPPGANGLVAQPYWSPGVCEPGPEARGALVGLNSQHTRADVYRALMEAMIFALRDGYERMSRRSGLRSQHVVVAGGGARSDQIMQLTANLFGLPARRNEVAEATALGAALNAAVGIGLFADYRQAIAAMCRPGTEFAADTTVARFYDEMYRDVYQRLYDRLKPLLRRLNSRQQDRSGA